MSREPLAAARWLLRLVWAAPLLVLLAMGLHGWLRGRAGSLRRQRALVGFVGLGVVTLTPSGRAPRNGAGSHAAIDLRHDPRMPDPGRER